MALIDAWRVIERKKSAGRIDRQTVQSFDRIHAKEIAPLSNQLKSGNYIPQPYARIDVSKPGKPNETRPLSLPAIRDKIVQIENKYRGEKVLLKHIIKNQVRGVGRYLRGEDDYRCFIGYY